MLCWASPIPDQPGFSGIPSQLQVRALPLLGRGSRFSPYGYSPAKCECNALVLLKPAEVYLPAPENLYTGKVMQLSTALGYAVILYQDKLVYSEAIRSNYSLRNNRHHSVASTWQLKDLASCEKPIQLNLLVSDHISLSSLGKCLHCCSKRGTAWSRLTGDCVLRDSNGSCISLLSPDECREGLQVQNSTSAGAWVVPFSGVNPHSVKSVPTVR